MALLAACLLSAGPLAPPARAQQPTGFTHAWGAGSGTIFNDEGRGVGVRHDGSVVWTGVTLDPTLATDDSVMPTTLVRKHSPAGQVCWELGFTGGEYPLDSVASRALALADPSLESPSQGLAYVVGRYRGTVNFNAASGAAPPSGEQEWGFVVKVRETDSACPGAGEAVWLRAFASPDHGACVATSVATARPARLCGVEQDSDSPGVYARVAVGGFFSGAITFDQTRVAQAADGFVCLLSTDGTITGWFPIAGPGNQRVTGVAIDERTQDLVVCGWFDDAQTDFDPGAPVVHAPNYQDGRDLFIARYRVPQDPEASPTLVWLYTYGRPATPGADFYDDEASSLALGVNDNAFTPPEACSATVQPRTLVFVGGATASSPATAPESSAMDLLFAAVPDPASGQSASAKWLYTPAGDGDDRVRAVTVDGLGRPVFTGHIGCYSPGAVCLPQEGMRVDFDPSGAHVALTTSNQDAFVVRYHPTNTQGSPPAPTLDWAYSLGGNFNEAGTAIAFDPASTSRFAWTGFFGKPTAPAFPPAYAIDLDPGPGVVSVSSQGKSDIFLSTLDPAAPQNVGHQITLVLSNACTMTTRRVGETFFPTLELVNMLDGLRINLLNEGVVPYIGSINPGNGLPRAKAVQVNAVFSTTTPVDGVRARQVMPWTVFDAATAPLFARRLAALAPLATGSTGFTTEQRLADGMNVAVASLARSGVTQTSVYSSMLVIANAEGGAGVPTARDAASGSAKFDRICAFGAYGASVPGGSAPPTTRSYQLLNIIAPTFAGQTDLFIDRNSTGISTGWSTMLRNPQPCEDKWWYHEISQRLLQRLSWCPSDFNRDECTDNNGNPSTDDAELWSLDRQGLVAYADWNMDLIVSTSENVDGPKLGSGFAGLPPVPNRRICNTCPQN